MTKINDEYGHFLEKFGTANQSQQANPSYRAYLDGKVPQGFIDFIEQIGLSVWQDGFFQFCDPQRYDRILKHVLEDDLDFDVADCHVLGFSSFGRLLVWHSQHRAMFVDLLRSTVCAAEYLRRDSNVTDEVSLGVATTMTDTMVWDAYPDYGSPLFAKCRDKHGILKLGKIYAPKAQSDLGVSPVIDDYRQASALEAMVLMAKSSPCFQLVDDRTYPSRVIRKIGKANIPSMG